jgi:branched-chain amino acid transport system substrate-binding protein
MVCSFIKFKLHLLFIVTKFNDWKGDFMKKNLNIFSLIFLVIILLFVLFFILGSNNLQIKNSEEIIKISVILPLSITPLISSWISDGMELVASEINDQGGIDHKKIEVIYEDSKADSKEGFIAFNKLVDVDNVNYIFSSLSSVSTPLRDLAEDKKIIHFANIVLVPDFAKNYEYTYRYHLTGDSESKKMASYLNDIGIDNVAVLYVNDAFEEGSYNSFKENYTGKNINCRKI